MQSTTLGGIKQHIREVLNCEPASSLDLVINNKVIYDNAKHDGKILHEFVSTSECVIKVLVRPLKFRQYFAKNLSDRTIVVPLRPDQTIGEVKFVIYAHDGVHVDQQRLVYRGEELDNDRTIANYNIPNESTFHLTLSLKGC